MSSVNKTGKNWGQTRSILIRFPDSGNVPSVPEFRPLTVGNGGQKATKAQLTFRYQGEKGPETYVIEQQLTSDEQMFIDLSDLIRTQKPDMNGHTFSPVSSNGTYTLLDLDNRVAGTLFEGKVVTDKRFGDAHYGCMICCGTNPNSFFDQNPFNVFTNDYGALSAQGQDTCSRQQYDITNYLTSWWSDNNSIATAQPAQGNGINPGNTNLWGDGWVPGSSNGIMDDPNGCPQNEATPQGPTIVCSSMLRVAASAITSKCTGSTWENANATALSDFSSNYWVKDVTINYDRSLSVQGLNFVDVGGAYAGGPRTATVQFKTTVGGNIYWTFTVTCNAGAKTQIVTGTQPISCSY